MNITAAGPWYTTSKPDAAQGIIADETTGRTVAVSYETGDARLIAAAPDLLRTLQAMVGVFNREESADPLICFAAIEQARYAIEKATQS